MDNLQEVVERDWQVGFRHSFDFNDITFYEKVGLQKWNDIYVVSIYKIDESKMVDEEFEVDEIKKFGSFHEAIDYIELNSRVLRHQLNVSKGQKFFNVEFANYI